MKATAGELPLNRGGERRAGVDVQGLSKIREKIIHLLYQGERGWVNVWMGVWMDDGWIDGQVNRSVGGQVDGWMDR